MAFIVPRVHINGTSKADLLAQTVDALEATSNLIQALRRAAPHGRDYRHQGEFSRATEHHDRRLRWLDALHTNLCTLGVAIDEQGP